MLCHAHSFASLQVSLKPYRPCGMTVNCQRKQQAVASDNAPVSTETYSEEGAAHVDVAEEDPVHRVVQQHVEALDRRHPRDLRHAKTARVVRLVDVATVIEGRLVGRAADDLEVLLRREGAAVSLGGGAFGDVVEERLRRRADDGDDVRASLGRGLGLQSVVVDVAGGDDDVLVRRGAGGDARLVRLALDARLVDAGEAGAGVRRQDAGGLACGERPLPVCALGTGEERRAEGETLGGVLHRVGAGGERPGEKEADAVTEEAGVAVAVDGDIDQRRPLVVDAGGAEGAEDGPLDADRGVRTDVRLDIVGDRAGELAALVDLACVNGNASHGDLIHGRETSRDLLRAIS